jgi:GTP-binding protein
MDVVFLTSAFRENQYPPPDRPEVAFAGRSNVGKSSLINVLVNRKGLAKTGSRPGRTQAINFLGVDTRLYLVDLPGYGYARVPGQVKNSWRSMVETYLSTRQNLQGVVVILDIRREPTPGDKNLLDWLKHYGIRTTLVLTKADKLSRSQTLNRGRIIERQIAEVSPDSPVIFSAKTRQGREEVWKKIEGMFRT